jgi:hypothetical protein
VRNARSDQRHISRKSFLEALERRRMLAALVIDGTAGPDVISLDVNAGIISVLRNGQPFTFNDSDFDEISINALGSADDVRVNRTGANQTTVSGGEGNDVLAISEASQRLLDVQSRVTFDGGAGQDELKLLNGNYAFGTEFQIGQARVFGYGGPEHRWSATETGSLDSGSGFNLIVVDLGSSGASVNLNAGNGADMAFVGISTSGVSTPNARVDMGEGVDSLTVTDNIASIAHDWTVTSTDLIGSSFGSVNYSNSEYLTLNTGAAPNRVDVNSVMPGSNTRVNTGGSDDDIHVNGTAPGTSVLIDGQTGLDNIAVQDVHGPASATLFFSQDLGAVSVAGAGQLRMGADRGAVVQMRSLGVSDFATLDIDRGTAIIDYAGAPPLPAVRADLVNGYSGGTWNGTGITSSAARASNNTAVGYAEASQLFSNFPATFAGQSIDNTTLILRHTLYGDTNLDRAVNVGDFARLAANFNASNTDWSAGNFNFDSRTDIADFALMAGNFNQSLARSIGLIGGLRSGWSDIRGARF